MVAPHEEVGSITKIRNPTYGNVSFDMCPLTVPKFSTIGPVAAELLQE